MERGERPWSGSSGTSIDAAEAPQKQHELNDHVPYRKGCHLCGSSREAALSSKGLSGGCLRGIVRFGAGPYVPGPPPPDAPEQDKPAGDSEG